MTHEKTRNFGHFNSLSLSLTPKNLACILQVLTKLILLVSVFNFNLSLSDDRHQNNTALSQRDLISPSFDKFDF